MVCGCSKSEARDAEPIQFNLDPCTPRKRKKHGQKSKKGQEGDDWKFFLEKEKCFKSLFTPTRIELE